MQLQKIFFESSPNRQRILLIFLSFFSFLLFVGDVHLFDWDEIIFAEITREMIANQDYSTSMIDFKPWYEKPPLFNWIQAVFFHLFGISDFSARLPNVIFGVLTILVLYNFGKRERGANFGMIWALVYFSSLLPHFFLKTGMMDPIFNFFIFTSCYFFITAYQKEERKVPNARKYFLLSGVLNGLGILTKGPVALLILILMLATYIVIYRKKITKKLIVHFLFFLLSVGFLTSLWVLPNIIKDGLTFVIFFTEYMIDLLTTGVADQEQPFYYHFLVVFFGCFPISIFALRTLFSWQRKSKHDLNRWMFCLFWVIIILFSLVTTKIVNYSSMTYFPLAYLAADILVKNDRKKLSLNIFLIVGLFISLVLLTTIIILSCYKERILDYFEEDIFTKDMLMYMDISLFSSLFPLLLLGIICHTYFSLKKEDIRNTIVVYALFFAVVINGIMKFIVTEVEDALQGPAIEFYKKHANKNVLLTSIDFMNYGQVYYFEKTKEQSRYSKEDMLYGDLNKTVYLLSRSDYDGDYIKRGDIEYLGQKGCFKFYKREPHK